MRPLELSELSEACYSLEGPEDSWLLGIVRILRPLLDASLGIAAWTFRVGHWGKSTDPPPVGVDPELGRALRLVGDQVPDELSRRFFLGPRALPACERIGRSVGLNRDPLFSELRPFRICDFRALTLVEPFGEGLAFVGPDQHMCESDPLVTRRLSRIGTHVLAGFRLRRSLGAMEAVLEPDGKLLHATGRAKVPAQRDALQRAVKAFDRACASRGASDPDEALSVWKGLVSGEWSLVQSFESDGRRYLIARRNPPGEPQDAAISPLAVQALTLRAQGSSYKHIAYELGMSHTRAYTTVRNAARALGVRSDGELASLLYRAIGPT